VGVAIDDFRVSASPLSVGPASVDFRLAAQGVELHRAVDRSGNLLLLLHTAASGHVEISVAVSDLEALIATVAKAEASKHGVNIDTVQLSLQSRSSRSLAAEVRLRAKKMFVGASLRITGQLDLDEQLNARISGLDCTGDGTIASLVTGAWMPGNLSSNAAAASGKWRVAPMPQWDAGGTATAENGGSSIAVMDKAANKTLAYAFVKYASADEGKDIRIKGGAFPSTTADLTSQTFLDTPFPYFGGQKANEIFAKSAQSVVSGWSYLPFQVYANSIFNDTVGKAYVSSTTLADGLKAWQDQSAKYGSEQGFTVK